MTSALMIQLINGRSIHSCFLNSIQVAVEARIPAVLPYTDYTLRQICGEGFWDRLDRGEKTRAGWCMVHLVAMGDLPFTVAASRHEYPVYYRLKRPSGADSPT